MRKFFFLIRYF